MCPAQMPPAASAVSRTPPLSAFERRALIAVCCVAVVLLFARLGDAALWQDEGQVAFLGATILDAGVPVAWDGRNLKNDQNFGHFFREDNLVWVMHTWVPMYLAAAGIAVGGHTALAVRVPFTLWALAAVPLLFLAVRRTTGRPRLAWLAVAVMLANVPFYLYARQANYYAVFYVLGIVLWWSLLRLGTHPRAWVAFAVGASLLYHCNALPFFAFYAALAVALGTTSPGRPQLVAFAQASALTAACTLPFFVWAGTAQRGGDVPWRVPGGAAYGSFLFRTLAESGLAVWPLAVLPLAVFARRAADETDPSAWRPRPLRTAAVIVAAFLLLFPVYSPLAFQRYYCVLFPLGYVLVAGAVDAVWSRRPAAGVALLAVLCTSTAGYALTWLPLRAWAALRANAAPQYAQLLANTQSGFGKVLRPTDLVRYANELTHEFTGPVEALVTYLRANAAPDDLVLSSYPHEPLAFYTDLRLCNRLYPDDPLAVRFPSYISRVQWPDWVIHRAQYPNTIFDYEQFLATQAQWYERIELDAVDTTWENRPLPHLHRYRTAREGPPLVIWKRRPDAPRDPWHLTGSAP